MSKTLCVLGMADARCLCTSHLPKIHRCGIHAGTRLEQPACLLTRPSEPARHVLALMQAEVYDRVIDDVLENMRGSFQDEGVDLGILEELRTVWKRKLTAMGAVVPPPPTAAAPAAVASQSAAPAG